MADQDSILTYAVLSEPQHHKQMRKKEKELPYLARGVVGFFRRWVEVRSDLPTL